MQTRSRDECVVILVVGAEGHLSRLLQDALLTEGYRVERMTDSRHTTALLEHLSPDIVLVDMLPGADGLELARDLRARRDVPIVILSGRDPVEDCAAGVAAARAVARARHGSLAYADVRLDLDTRQVFRGGRSLELRNKAFELLACFMRHPERVLSRRELLEEVWDYEFLGDSNVIEVTVSHIRQALEAEGMPRLIHTVRPVGYILHARPSG